MANPEERNRKGAPGANQTDATADPIEGTNSSAGEEDVLLLTEATVPQLEAELEEAMQEIQRFKDLALRAEAESQNVRRRAERDVENAHKYGSEKLIGNLLPIIDSLEKAIEAVGQADGIEDAAAKAIVEGVDLCQKMLVDVLGKEGVTVVNPEGAPFDPNEHQAMAMVDAPDTEPGSVVAVVQKGYALNGRLIRPAMVMVSKSA